MIPVSPAAHYLIGGIAVDLDGRTAVENLFAVGEVASTGVHGANRLASNSLLEGLVFGYRVASAAAANKAPEPGDDLEKGKDLKREAGAAQEQLCRKIRPLLQELMWENAGLIRAATGLNKAREKIQSWWPVLEYDFTDTALIETQNMLLVAAMMVESALARRESRGCHYRDDYPDPDLDLGKTHICFQAGGATATGEAIAYPQPSFVE